MKSWIPIPEDLTVCRRVVLHKLGGFVARLLLFGSVFLMHPGERCVYETGWVPSHSEDVTSVGTPQAAAAPAPIPDNLPLTF